MALSASALIRGLVSRLLPQPNADSQNNDVALRLKRYGDVIDPIFTKHVLADEGAYYTACMTPAQAALAYGLQTSFADIAGFVAVMNTDLPLGQGTGKRVYLDYIKFILSVAPASATAAWVAIKIDSTNRTPSANQSLITPSNMNMDSSLGSISKVWFPTGGTLTLPVAGGAARLVTGNLCLRTVIPVVSDEFIISFGNTDFSQIDQNQPAALATVATVRKSAPPFIIGPQQFALIHLWFPGNAVTAASFSNIEVGLVER